MEALILLHGLARSSRPMRRLAQAATAEARYRILNLDYPSTRASIEVLTEQHLWPAVQAQLDAGASRVHFVTHSMGGILVRQLLAHRGLPQLGRVVMLGPPNAGSELVDRLAWLPPFDWINGPAGRQLGTVGPHCLPKRLGPMRAGELGIIAGTRFYNPFYAAVFRGAHDGKVSVASARLEGMRDFLVLPVNHTFMMSDARVIRQTLHFLREGRFDRKA